jgi:tRNA G18 (ribose-2'-O)-methylase SpoU
LNHLGSSEKGHRRPGRLPFFSGSSWPPIRFTEPRNRRIVAPIIELSQASDPRLERYANLRSDRQRRFDADSFIAEGRWCLQRLIDSPYEIISVLADQRRADEVAHWLPPTTTLYSLPPEQIRQLVGFNFHRGMLACGRRVALRPADELRFRPGEAVMSLAMLGINQHENVGSMMRSAAAFGIGQLLIGPSTADPLSRRSIRVSMAAVFRQTLYTLDRPHSQLLQLQRTRHVRTIVTTLDASGTPLSEFVPDEREAILVVGNEAEGVERSVQEIATDRVTIPMRLGTDSLNVSIAAAIAMYQLLYPRSR